MTPFTKLLKMVEISKLTELTKADRKAIHEDAQKLLQFLDAFVYDAHIAGSLSTKGKGLNLSKEERADGYCKQKGLRT